MLQNRKNLGNDFYPAIFTQETLDNFFGSLGIPVRILLWLALQSQCY
ncbi:hypothetical protein I6E06_04645 [Bifidobacterium boum]|nr:hypothetical protein [Bifidobacterium boum]MCF2561757.1 hypothetical protein [Bifidobacterium boum]